MNALPVWSVPHPSQEFEEGPILKWERPGLTVSYDFETSSGTYAWEQLAFVSVAAMTFTSLENCTAEQIAAYDVLHELFDSDWGTRLGRTELRHFRLFFDELGCYEFLASDFVAPSAPESKLEP